MAEYIARNNSRLREGPQVMGGAAKMSGYGNHVAGRLTEPGM
jgi:hypothetical protein